MYLLKGVHAFGEDIVPGDDHHDGHLGVDKRQGSVLQLSGLDTLAVHVGQLFHLDFIH